MTPTRWVYVALAAFGAGFVAFWPRLFLVVDEERYVSQAVAFAHGSVAVPGSGIVFPAVGHATISNYPPGTSLLQAPFVAVAGWRAAPLVSAFALVLATLATMRWLRARGGHPAFALLLPGFVAASFFGRIAMSDLPATALVAAAGWLLWRADGQRAALSALAGLVTGSVLLFREPVILLLAPLMAGAMLRRRVVSWALLAGLGSAIALRLSLSAALFGSPWYLRDPGFGFSLGSVAHTAPVYALVLLVLLPGAALLPFAYRGERRVELGLGVCAYVGLFLLYDYDGIALNGAAKGMMLMSRFMIPAVPLIAIMASEVWPRWSGRLRLGRARPAFVHAAGFAAAATAFAVHPLAARQEEATLPVQRAIQRNTRPDAPVITNSDATLKYLSPAYSTRRLLLLPATPPESLSGFSRRYGVMDVVVLDRSDSRVFNAMAARDDRFVSAARARCAVQDRLDTLMADGSRLRVLELRSCR